MENYINIKRLVSYLYTASSILTITSLFTFIAALTGISISLSSQILMLVNFLYVFTNFKVFKKVIKKKELLLWLILVLFWPLLTVVYAPGFNLRNIALQIYYGSILISSSIYFWENDWYKVWRIFLISLAITLVGLALSLIDPSLFSLAAKLSGEQSVDSGFNGRAFGFFLQPNIAAFNTSLILCIVGARANLKKANVLGIVGWFIFCILPILATGSRGGLVIIVASILIQLVDFVLKISSRNYSNSSAYSRRKIIGISNKLFQVIGIILCFFLIAAPIASYTTDLMQKSGYGYLANRLGAITTLDSAESVAADKSVQARLEAQDDYLDTIYEYPLLGKGLGSPLYDRTVGKIYKVSHNLFLEKSYEFGIPYAMFLLYVLLNMSLGGIKKSLRPTRPKGLPASIVPIQVSLMIFLASMVSSSVFSSRTLLFTLGIFAISGRNYARSAYLKRSQQ